MSSGTRVLNGFLGFVLGAIALCAAGSVTAQTLVAPPVMSVLDSNGVNLATGKFDVPGMSVGIGTQGSGLARAARGEYDNYTGIFAIQAMVGGPVGDGNIYGNVSFGGGTYRFHLATVTSGTVVWDTGPYFNQIGGTATLDVTNCSFTSTSGICTLLLPDGTKATYDLALAHGPTGNITSITKTDGEIISFSGYTATSTGYTSAVTSSLGWMLKYDSDTAYKPTKITAINTTVDYCTATNNCTPTSSSPSAAISTSGSTKTISINGVNAVSYTVTGTETDNTTTILTPSGVTKTFTTVGGKVTSVSQGGSTWMYGYVDNTMAGTLTITVTLPNTKTRKTVINYFTYRILSQTDEFGRVTSYEYDTATGHVTKVINPDGNTATGGFTSFTYNADGNQTSTIVVPKGGAVGGVVTAGAAVISSAHYPACTPTNRVLCHKPDYVIDANGVRTDYVYDATHGGVLTVTLPAVAGVAPKTTYSYGQITPLVKNSATTWAASAPVWRLTQVSSCSSLASCANTADEARTVTSYADSSHSNTNPNYKNVLPYATTTQVGNAVLSSAASGTNVWNTTAYTYDNNGNVLTVNPKSGTGGTTAATVYYFYDNLNRKSAVIGVDPDGAGSRNRPAIRTAYNVDGQVSEVKTGTVTAATESALTTMDVIERDTNEFSSANGLPTIARHYVGSATTPKDLTQRSYDNMFRLDCEAVRLNPVDFPTPNLPASACTLGTTTSDGMYDRITKYGYDFAGQVLSVTTGYGTSVATAEATKVYATSSATSSGTLSYVEDAKGNRTTYSYDAFNRAVMTCYPMAATAHSSNTHDCDQVTYGSVMVGGVAQAASRPASAILRTDPSNSSAVTAATIVPAYDALGRVNATTGAIVEGTTFDNFNRVLTHTKNSNTETYTYNALGWLLTDSQAMGTINYSYDGYGKRTKLTYPGAGLYISYAYDDGDELVRICENVAASSCTGTSTLQFTYDSFGRASGIVRDNGYNTGFGYDGSLRLASVSNAMNGSGNAITLAYSSSDQISSRLNGNAAFDAPSLAVGTTSYGINGLNQVTTTGGPLFAYDARGNLTSDGGAVTFSYSYDNMLTGTSAGATLLYDATDRLQSYTAGGVTTKFLYDGVDLIAEYSGSGTLLRRYVHGPGSDQPLIWYEGTGTATKRYFMSDERGSIIGVTDAAGTVLAINKYDAYGVPSTSNATYAGRFRFTGQVWLSELGLYNYKARMYAPSLGRFLQTDPIGYGDGMNWYAYVGNDPINSIDPLGLYGTAGGGPQGVYYQSSFFDQDEVVIVGHRHTCPQTCKDRIDAMRADNYADWARASDSCHGNIGCMQYVQNRMDHYTENTVSLPGLTTYIGVITAPLMVYDAAEIGLAFTASKGKVILTAAEGCLRCLVAGTEVETPNGLVAIEFIKVGDLVLAYDETTGQLHAEPVTALIRPDPQATFAVTLEGADHGKDVFRASADHPWLLASGEWKSTAELKPGDLIKTATGIRASVVSVTPTGKLEQTYNLTVDGLHTYLIGKNHVVVHNAVCQKLVAEAERLYPKLADKFNDHHIWPRYLGGPANGPLARIPAAYHQLITNAFREAAPYGKAFTGDVQLLIKDIAAKIPLP